MANDFNNRLDQELIKSETIRIKTLLYIVGIGMLSALFMFIVFPTELSKIFSNPNTAWMLLESSLILFLFELYVLLQIRKLAKKKQNFPRKIRYLGTFVEITFPSTVILFTAISENTHTFLDSPAFLFYFFFLILSPLRLDFYLSIFTGAVAFLEYLAISSWVLKNHLTEHARSLSSLHAYHIEKSVVLLISGVIAGFVAREIHRKIKSAAAAEQERNDVKMLFGQQVSKAVMDELLEHKSLQFESRKLEVTIMFMDIRNFTPFAEKRSPEEIIAFQNAIFSPIIEIIHQHDGIINQIMGDGFMSTFGAPISSKNHCEEAAKAAIAMVEKIQELVNEGKIPATRIGIGLHTGNVVAGNIGNKIRQQYSITGTTVITAARIEQLNKQYNTQLLISQAAYEHINGLQPNFEFLEDVHLKGQAKEIGIYRFKE
ncbi:MAG: adenylate/guanylate cyclase domain-containing protein [Flammeovirgaceae bacterium]